MCRSYYTLKQQSKNITILNKKRPKTHIGSAKSFKQPFRGFRKSQDSTIEIGLNFHSTEAAATAAAPRFKSVLNVPAGYEHFPGPVTVILGDTGRLDWTNVCRAPHGSEEINHFSWAALHCRTEPEASNGRRLDRKFSPVAKSTVRPSGLPHCSATTGCGKRWIYCTGGLCVCVCSAEATHL